MLPLSPALAAVVPRTLDGTTLAVLWVAVLATLAARFEISARAAHRTFRGALVGASLAIAGMALLRAAGAAYLSFTDPLAGTTPLLVLDTFLPVLLGGAAVLWLLTLTATLWPRLRERRRTAWLQVVPPLSRMPLWTAGLAAVGTTAYATHLGGWIALQVLFG